MVGYVKILEQMIIKERKYYDRAANRRENFRT